MKCSKTTVFDLKHTESMHIVFLFKCGSCTVKNQLHVNV